MNAINIENLHIFLKGHHFYQSSKLILKNVSLQIKQGEICGLIGSNGAGKSTLIKTILGLIFPKKGTINIFGYPAGSIETHQLLGYLPEHPHFYLFLTSRGLLDFYANLYNIPRHLRRQRIEQTLERVGLANVPGSRTLQEYSKGMLQRIGIAQAILHDPKLLLLDEPMSGLDPMGRYEMAKLIQSLGNEGKTILFSSHILHDIETLCDRVAIISHGELLKNLELKSILTSSITGIEVIIDNVSHVEMDLVKIATTWETQGERLLIRVPDVASLTKVLTQAQKKNLDIIGINILRDSLEKYFISQMEAGEKA